MAKQAKSIRNWFKVHNHILNDIWMQLFCCSEGRIRVQDKLWALHCNGDYFVRVPLAMACKMCTHNSIFYFTMRNLYSKGTKLYPVRRIFTIWVSEMQGSFSLFIFHHNPLLSWLHNSESWNAESHYNNGEMGCHSCDSHPEPWPKKQRFLYPVFCYFILFLTRLCSNFWANR